MNEREWLIFSKIILMMNDIEDIDRMREYVMHAIKRLIAYDAASFFLSCPPGGSALLRDPVSINMDIGELEYYAAEKSSEGPFAWTNEYPRNLIIADSLNKNNQEDACWYYDSLKKKFGLTYQLIISLAWSGNNVGTLTLMRKEDSGDFGEHDIQIANQFVDHIAQALHRRMDHGEKTFSSERISHRLRDISRLASLSSREEQVFILLCQGKSPDAICHELFITEATFKKHSTAIYRKLKIKSRYELMSVVFPELDAIPL